MVNSLLSVSMIAAESLMELGDQLVLGNLIYRDKTSDFNQVGGYSVGDTVRVRNNTALQTNEFTQGGNINIQDIRQQSRNFVIEKHYDVSVELSSRELALEMDDFTREVVQPAMVSMAEQIESYLGEKLADSGGLYTSNDLLATAADMSSARARANSYKIPMAGRLGIVDNNLEAKLLGADYFHRADIRSAPESVPALRDARLGRVMGVDWYGTLYFPVATRTAGDGTTTTDNAGGTANLLGQNTLSVAATAGTFEVGDKITVAGVRRPMTVATQATAGATSLDLVDPIEQIIPDGAAVTVISSTDTYEHQGVICDPNAFAWANPPLDLPPDADSSVATANGMSIRVVRQYNVTNKQFTISFDCLVGAISYDPRISMLLADIA